MRIAQNTTRSKVPRTALTAVAVLLATLIDWELVNAQSGVAQLVGTRRTNRGPIPCSLSISEHGFTQANSQDLKDYYIIAQVSDQHGTDSPGTFRLTHLQDANKILMRGQNERKDSTLTIELSSGAPNYQLITAYYLDWNHGNHPHRYACLNMAIK